MQLSPDTELHGHPDDADPGECHSGADDAHEPAARLIVVMGVTGSGKSTFGPALARELGAGFLDGDDYHPRANVEKMALGYPLTDEDRWPWLSLVAGAMRGNLARAGQTRRKARGAGLSSGARCVAACSALRQVYRRYLQEQAGEPIYTIHLSGPGEIIRQRLQPDGRRLLSGNLLERQLAQLEPLAPDEFGHTADITRPVSELVAEALSLIERLDTPR